MGPSAKSLRELLFTVPSLRIYANVAFTLKSLQFEAKSSNDPSGRQKALIQLTCEPVHTEILRSLSDIQDKLGESVYVEVKLTSQGKGGATRLDVFTGRIDLTSQMRSNILEEDPMVPVTLRVRLVHVVGGDCDSGKVARTFGHLTMTTISELVQKAFDDE
ncbi:hypothetical protein BOX15_Mlig008011g3 [Macrostomum lignano]|nr:hypothetical protein BOX15_Mlig008011g3 [Macrostomum lignano]